MTFDSLGAWWLVAAVLLGLAELAVPGVFLVFLAAAAAITGAFLLLFPELPVPAQLLSFAVWAAIAVWIGRRWYGASTIESSDPLLNDRVARLLGEVVVVTQAIEGGSGRVRVGDGEWLARGPDTAAGERVRIQGVQGSALIVETLAIEDRTS